MADGISVMMLLPDRVWLGKIWASTSVNTAPLLASPLENSWLPLTAMINPLLTTGPTGRTEAPLATTHIPVVGDDAVKVSALHSLFGRLIRIVPPGK